MKKINIAVIGLGFGANFAEIFANHPNVENVIVVDLDARRVKEFMEKTGNLPNIKVYDSFDAVLKDESIDAVHICTGIDSHAKLTVKALNHGKHCACAVPMATSLEEIRAIVDAARKSGKNYMMMETDLFGFRFFKAKEMLDKGEFGKVQHMRGVHYQPMDDGYWNTEKTAPYWNGLPPMHYATHAIAPLYKISNSVIESVICVGTGTMSEKFVSNYGNPYPIEEALLCFENGLKGEVVRGLFECSAPAVESFNIYGSRKSFMAEYINLIVEKVYDEDSDWKGAYVREALVPVNYYQRLPKELWKFTIRIEDGRKENYEEYLDKAPLAPHHAAHPHLCHEFISSIIEKRKSYVDEDASANITAAGICAHISAMKGGEKVKVPKF